MAKYEQDRIDGVADPYRDGQGGIEPLCDEQGAQYVRQLGASGSPSAPSIVQTTDGSLSLQISTAAKQDAALAALQKSSRVASTGIQFTVSTDELTPSLKTAAGAAIAADAMIGTVQLTGGIFDLDGGNTPLDLTALSASLTGGGRAASSIYVESSAEPSSIEIEYEESLDPDYPRVTHKLKAAQSIIGRIKTIYTCGASVTSIVIHFGDA